VLSSEVFDGGWGILFTILVGLVSLSTAMAGFDTLRRRRSDGYFALRFPDYAGGRFPLFYLLRYEGPAIRMGALGYRSRSQADGRVFGQRSPP
jgi:hypothetical protein